MTATYTLPAEEITIDIIQSIRDTFKGKKINIVVTEDVEEEMDETEYLMRSPANKQMLLESIQEAKEGKTVTFTIEEFKVKYGEQ